MKLKKTKNKEVKVKSKKMDKSPTYKFAVYKTSGKRTSVGYRKT
jgi:hypothetical protein